MNKEQFQKLIEEMYEDVDERSEAGELDRHDCRYVAEHYMKLVYQSFVDVLK